MMESRAELFARIRRDARVRAYPSAAMPGSTGAPEEPFGGHWPLRNHLSEELLEARSWAAIPRAGRHPALRLDDPRISY